MNRIALCGVLLTLVACGADTGPDESASGSTSTGSSNSNSSSSSSSSSSSASSSTGSGGAMPNVLLQENARGFCSMQGVIESDHAGYTGAGYVNTENASGAGINWQVTSTGSRTVQLQIRYANGGDTPRDGVLSVNGGSTTVEHVSFPSATSWADWRVAEVGVTLEDGFNSLALAAESAAGLANIDSLGIVGSGVSAADCNVVTPPPDDEESWSATVPFRISGQDAIHDPSTIVRDGDTYWTYGTGQGAGRPINALYSYDLMTWHQGDSPVAPRTYPDWIDNELPTFDGNFWAPDIIEMNDRYYLYYSAFSSTVLNSAIGVMVTDSLNNPDWRDLGLVVSTGSEPRSSRGEPVNAIDAGLYRDADGNVWMTYGSHYAGIRQIDPATGLLRDNVRYNAAGNNGGWNEYEAAQVQYINGFYYLFVNLGDCCVQLDSDYILYVGRSDSPTGPFITESGHNLWHGDVISQQQIDAGVTTGSVLSTQPGRVGPGHFGYLRHKGQDLASIHYYGGNDGWGHLGILEMTFVNGWPVFSYDFELRQ